MPRSRIRGKPCCSARAGLLAHAAYPASLDALSESDPAARGVRPSASGFPFLQGYSLYGANAGEANAPVI